MERNEAIYVGKKPMKFYFNGVIRNLWRDTNVTLIAYGRNIAKAVDIAESVKKLCNIREEVEIDTVKFENKREVSMIKIRLIRNEGK